MASQVLDIYKKHAFITFSLNVEWNGIKKVVHPPIEWQKIEEAEPFNSYKNGLAIITGKVSGITVIDIDDLTEGTISAELSDLCDECCDYKVRTNKGFHYYFKYDDRLESKQYKKFDIKNDGGFVLAPPTMYNIENKEIVYKIVKHKKLNKINDKIMDFLRLHIEEHKKIEQNKKMSEITNVNINNLEEFRTKYVRSLLGSDLDFDDTFKEMLKDLYEHLSVKNRESYGNWMKLFFVSVKFGKYGYNLFVEFSKKTKSYDLDEIERKLKTIDTDGVLTLGSLRFWLQEDNIEYYKIFCEKYSNLFTFLDGAELIINLKRFINEDQIGIAQIYVMYNRTFLKCTNKSKADTVFYRFDQKSNLWLELLGKDISTDLQLKGEIYLSPLLDYYNKKTLKAPQDEEEAKKYLAMIKTKIKNIHDFQKKMLKTNAMLNIANNNISSLLFDREGKFINLLDSKIGELPCSGMILCADGSSRPRTSEDYFSKEIPVKLTDFDMPFENRNTDFINRFFMDIFFDDVEMVEYFQKYLGYSAFGFRKDEVFSIWYGGGGNGKGLTQTLIESTFGKFYSSASRDVFMDRKKGSAGGTAEHLKNIQRTRFAICDEGESDGKLNEADIKQITGQGVMSIRGLYSSQEQVTPTCNLILITNHLPEIQATYANRRRILCFPFEKKYVSKDEYDQLLEEEKTGYGIRDNNLRNKLINEHLEEFLIWVIQGAIKYSRNGSLGKKPKKILEATEEYFNERDPVMSFLEDCTIKTGSKKDLIKIKEAYDLYKDNGGTYGRNNFCQKIRDLGFYKRTMGLRYVVGFKLKPEFQNDEEENTSGLVFRDLD